MQGADPVSGFLRAESEARTFIRQRLDEGDVDAFIAAYFLSHYGREDQHVTSLQTKLRELSQAFHFTRANVTMLGIGLKAGWLPITERSVGDFTHGIAQLERQRPHVGEQLRPGLDYRRSLKLLWGLSLGASCPAVAATSSQLSPTIAAAVRNYRSSPGMRPRDYVVATMLLGWLEADRMEVLATDLAYYLLRLDIKRLPDADALAALWALKQGCFGSETSSLPRDSMKNMEEFLEKRVFSLSDEHDDVIGALIADWLLDDVRRYLASGARIAQDALSMTLRTLDAFAEVARRLRNRRKGHPSLEVQDEYDVQDLLYAALKPHIPDLSDEEWTPKDAGGAKKIDFLSRAARLGIEAKKTRDAEHANRSVPDELKIDIESYHRIEECDNLVIFIYDPDHYTVDPRTLEAHLSGPRVIKGHRVEVIARVRP